MSGGVGKAQEQQRWSMLYQKVQATTRSTRGMKLEAAGKAEGGLGINVLAFSLAASPMKTVNLLNVLSTS